MSVWNKSTVIQGAAIIIALIVVVALARLSLVHPKPVVATVAPTPIVVTPTATPTSMPAIPGALTHRSLTPTVPPTVSTRSAAMK